METLLNRITQTGLDAAAVSGEKAILFWGHVRQHIATTAHERALCYVISAEYRHEMKQWQISVEELRAAISLLELPADLTLLLSVKHSLSERLIDLGQYDAALAEYIAISNIAVEYGNIDNYVLAIIGMGNLCDVYGEHSRALRYYQKIDSFDHAISSRTLRLRYKLSLVACYLRLGRYAIANDLLKECEELSILLSDKLLAGQIMLYQAKLYLQQGEFNTAMLTLANAQFSSSQSVWLLCMLRIELAHCLARLDKVHLATLLLSSCEKRLQQIHAPYLEMCLYQAFSEVCEYDANYTTALDYAKKAFAIESDLIKRIPISELGAIQLRRLARFEPQLKLILSELENRELKETTEHQKNTVLQLQQDVFSDPLTQLHNRRWLDMKLKDLLLHDTPFAFLVVDIDHFKSINDELSHLVGDKAIVNVARELADYFKFRGASCVRFGGEEFLVILENITREMALMHAEHYRQRIFDFAWHNILGERGLTVSIGITEHRDGEKTQRTFYRADKALYRAKANGRNQVCIE